ncbi:MAG TPA: helix-turn-helix domain-containing protein, partial [Acidimicrobiales bacterium]|nr:helix-turn-helix domain-containing protein [Acidimicrobiales bacterium]
PYHHAVPRNRADVARDVKVDEIVEAARARLVDGGYGALSVAGLARELGLAQAAVYWYFPTKDDLFVAAVERILHDILERKPRRGTTIDRVLWLADRLHEFHDLRMTMRDRARVAEGVARFEADVNALFRVLLINALRDDVDGAEIDDVADAVMALCDGVLLRDLGQRRRRELIRFGFERLVR